MEYITFIVALPNILHVRGVFLAEVLNIGLEAGPFPTWGHL